MNQSPQPASSDLKRIQERLALLETEVRMHRLPMAAHLVGCAAELVAKEVAGGKGGTEMPGPPGS